MNNGIIKFNNGYIYIYIFIYIHMVGGLEHLDYFSIQLEIVIPTDFHIFQRGRYTMVYHQPENIRNKDQTMVTNHG